MHRSNVQIEPLAGGKEPEFDEATSHPQGTCFAVNLGSPVAKQAAIVPNH
jgi:hypothetical protein